MNVSLVPSSAEGYDSVIALRLYCVNS